MIDYTDCDATNAPSFEAARAYFVYTTNETRASGTDYIEYVGELTETEPVSLWLDGEYERPVETLDLIPAPRPLWKPRTPQKRPPVVRKALGRPGPSRGLPRRTPRPQMKIKKFMTALQKMTARRSS